MKVYFCDMYNFAITGDISANMDAASCDSPTHSGPSLLILNDQGGDIMNMSSDVTSTLRAQDHGHPPVVCIAFDVYNMQGNPNVFKTMNNIATDSDHIPVICFEPGIAKREGNTSRFVDDMCGTLRADMGDNQPAVCYQQKTDDVYVMSERQISMMVTKNVSNSIVSTDYKGAQVICCEADNE